MSDEINLKMLHSLYRVEVKSYDSGHGGSVPDDYTVLNDKEVICKVSSESEAVRIRTVYNQMRKLLLKQLLDEA